MYTLTPDERWFAQEALKRAAWLSIYRQTVRSIIDQVAEKTGIPRDDICGGSRIYRIKDARQAVMYRARCEGRSTTPKIAKALGLKDHSTVVHGARVYAERHGLPMPWVADATQRARAA